MKVSYKELMKKLGVDRELNLYETQPWLMYDDEKGVTCEAEVRCNHDRSEIEAEMQFVYDKPEAGKHPVERVCHIMVHRNKQSESDYRVVSCDIQGKEYKSAFFEWEIKSCNFFRACVRDIKLDKLPNIDEILKAEMKDTSRHKRGGGDGSNKAPKIDASQLMYDRKGIGAGF